MLREGVQGAEVDALCSSVNDDIWYQEWPCTDYAFLFLQVTVEELGNLYNL